MQKKLAVIGMKHSGSTLLHELMKRIVKLYPGFLPNVHKYHIPPLYDPDITYIMTIRDVRDTCISNFFRFYMEKEHVEDDGHVAEIYGMSLFMNNMLENISIHNYDVQLCSHIWVYEVYKSNPLRTMENLCLQVFGYVENDIETCIREAEEIKDTSELAENLKDYHDKKKKDRTCSLLLRDHDTSGGKFRKYEFFFTEYQKKYILQNDIIQEWLHDYGYLEKTFNILEQRAHCFNEQLSSPHNDKQMTFKKLVETWEKSLPFSEKGSKRLT